jgi:hypothetical protein
MTVKINADTSDGLKIVSDTSGAIDFQSNGSTKMSMDASGNLTANSFVGSALKLLHVQDEKGTTTHGGSASANTDNIRDLNTVKTNEITGASLSSNQITLPAGTYFVEALASGLAVDHHRAFLYNVTDSDIEVLGMQIFNSAWNTLTSGFSPVYGRFTISGTKVFELRHRTQSAKADIGLGHYMNDTRSSIYSSVIIRKIS